MNYSTEQIKAIKEEAEAVVAELEAQAKAAAEDAEKSGLAGTAGQEMKRVVAALNQNLEEARKEAKEISEMADSKVTSQEASDNTVSGYTQG